MEKSNKNPPNSLPIYRILTGIDDAEFCRRLSEAIQIGYELYGSPSSTFNGSNVIVAQAVVWPSYFSKSNPEREAISFRSIDWTKIPKTEHMGETGTA